jgi:2-phosphoglycerate kinase
MSLDFSVEKPEEAPEILVEEAWGPEDEHRELRLFSRGIVVQSLLRLGMPPEEAWRIANDVRDELEERGAKRVPRSKLHEMLLSRLEGLQPSEARYADRLRYLDERGRALVVLVGGTSGSGKSTAAAKVARRLGIEHMVGTDSLREALRSAIPPSVSPALHESSYTAHKTLATFVKADGKVERLGFLEHARPVASAVNGLLRRARTEDIGVVAEGIHVIPSLIEETYREAPDVIVAMVSVPDAEEHKQRFLRASRREPRRGNAARYLENFSTIREIHDFLTEDATKHGCPVIGSKDPDSVASEIIERLWRRVLGAGG